MKTLLGYILLIALVSAVTSVFITCLAENEKLNMHTLKQSLFIEK